MEKIITSNFAVSYDWLYNFYFEKFGQEGVDRLADIIYEKGVSQGYNVSSGGLCAYPKTAGGDDVYTTLKNNWNASCSSSMIIGALAISSYGKYEDVNSYLIGNNMQNLI